MSATVAAALKKIAVAILTDKKLRKTFLGIVLGIIVIIVMPFAAIIALFNGGINIDTNRLQTLVVQNMSAEEQASHCLSDICLRTRKCLCRTAPAQHTRKPKLECGYGSDPSPPSYQPDHSESSGR